MKKKKLYFNSDENDGIAAPLDHWINEAKELREEKTVLVYEAVRDHIDDQYVWCGIIEEAGERSGCKKSLCTDYDPRNGKNGVCKHRGKLYTWGTPHVFDVETGKELPIPEQPNNETN